MGSISLIEFERRYASGYEFLVSSSRQADDGTMSFSFLQVYDKIYISLDPDAIVLMDSQGHGRLGIGVITGITEHKPKDTPAAIDLEISFSVNAVTKKLVIRAVKIK